MKAWLQELSPPLGVLYLFWLGFLPPVFLVWACFSSEFSEASKILLWMSFVFIFPLSFAQLSMMTEHHPKSNVHVLYLIAMPFIVTAAQSWLLDLDFTTSVLIMGFGILASRMFGNALAFWNQVKKSKTLSDRVSSLLVYIPLSIPILVFSGELYFELQETFGLRIYYHWIAVAIFLISLIENTREYYRVFKDDY